MKVSEFQVVSQLRTSAKKKSIMMGGARSAQLAYIGFFANFSASGLKPFLCRRTITCDDV
jgi:hypothetical protein